MNCRRCCRFQLSLKELGDLFKILDYGDMLRTMALAHTAMQAFACLSSLFGSFIICPFCSMHVVVYHIAVVYGEQFRDIDLHGAVVHTVFAGCARDRFCIPYAVNDLCYNFLFLVGYRNEILHGRKIVLHLIFF